MNLYKISRDTEEYGEYDSIVVVAKDDDAARLIYPDPVYNYRHSWIKPGEQVTVECIGQAAAHLTENTVVLASYNAG